MQISMAPQSPMSPLFNPEAAEDSTGAFEEVINALGDLMLPQDGAQSSRLQKPGDVPSQPPAYQEAPGPRDIYMADQVWIGPDMVFAATTLLTPHEVPPGHAGPQDTAGAALGPASAHGLAPDYHQPRPGFDLSTAIPRSGGTDQPPRPPALAGPEPENPPERGIEGNQSLPVASTEPTPRAGEPDLLAPDAAYITPEDQRLPQPDQLPASIAAATVPPNFVALRDGAAVALSAAPVVESAGPFRVAERDAATTPGSPSARGQTVPGHGALTHAAPSATSQGTMASPAVLLPAQDNLPSPTVQKMPPAVQRAAFTQFEHIHPEHALADPDRRDPAHVIDRMAGEAPTLTKQASVPQAVAPAQSFAGQTAVRPTLGAGVPSPDTVPLGPRPLRYAGTVSTAEFLHPVQQRQPARATSATDIAQDTRELIAPSREPVAQPLSAASSGATLPTNSPSPPPVYQVAQSVIQFIRSDGSSPIELTLQPEELGKMRFDISTSGDRISVILFIERPDALDLIRRHGEQLLNDLRLSGFSNPSLSFGEWSQRNARSGARAGQTGGRGADTAQGVNPAVMASPRMPTIAGRLDLRL